MHGIHTGVEIAAITKKFLGLYVIFFNFAQILLVMCTDFLYNQPVRSRWGISSAGRAPQWH